MYTNLSGQKFGYLEVLKEGESHFNKYGRTRRWECKCICGKEVLVSSGSLTSGGTKSCGCKTKQLKLDSWKERGFKSDLDSYYKNYKRSAEIRKYSFDLSFEEFSNLVEKDCIYCGIAPDKRKKFPYNGIDRIDNGLGYKINNCVPCCGKCNRLKGTLHKDAFLSQIEKIYKNIWQSDVGGDLYPDGGGRNF